MTDNHIAHTIHHNHRHYGWDNSLRPALHAEPGQTLFIQCLDAAGGHFHPESTDADIETMAAGKVNPVTGPIRIAGALPGDALKITFNRFHPSGFGWTALIPGFGLLADQFPDPQLHLWKYDPGAKDPAMFGSHAAIPVRPFAGTVGVAPAEPGRHDVIPPRNVGGNMDIRDLTAGSVLYLPVEVEGALLSIGDTHAAQGDGEVCGTAIESAMDVELTVDLVKEANLPAPRFSTPGPVSGHVDRAGYEVTTGIGPDLYQACRDAVRCMIDLLCARHGMRPQTAYMLVSVCADLRISEIVDAPNWVASFYLPRSVFQ